MGLMDFLGDVGLVVNGGYATKSYLQRRNATYHRILSGEFKQDVKTLIGGLDSLDSHLQNGEIAAYLMTDYSEKIAAIREKLGIVKDAISKPFNAYEILDEAWSFTNAVRAAGKFESGKDPLGEAKAYGAAIKSFGKIAGRLPLVSVYGPILEELGDAFAQIVGNIVPHLKGTHQRVDEKWIRTGEPSIWSPP